MSHKIGQYDRQEGISQAWHGLTYVREHIPANDTWLHKWDVEKRPMLDPDGSVSDYCRVVCTDNDLLVGKPVHKTSYSLIDNKRFLELINDCLLSIRGAKIETVGSVRNRGRVFVSISIQDMPEFKAAGRKFVPYLNFLNSHDQSSLFAVNASNICTVCDNTFRYNLEDTKNNVFRTTLKHTKNVVDRLDDVDRMIDCYVGTQARFKAAMDNLDSIPISIPNARNFFAGIMTERIEEPSTRFINAVDRMSYLFWKGRGNNGATRADAFSAVTDYYTHESSGGENVAKQFESSEFGHGAEMKTQAFDALLDGSKFTATVNRGDKILSLV